MVEGWLPIFFLMIVLKVPVAALLYIVWWASRAEVEPEEAPEADDGGSRFFDRPRPRRPFGPRRGPGSAGAPLPAPCPPGGRVRAPRTVLPAQAAHGRTHRPEH
jgi:hypothetical protein